MAKPYSSDLRARVIEAIEEGATREEAAERHQVSLSSVGRFLRLKREKGSVSPAQFGGYKPYALAAHEHAFPGNQRDGTVVVYARSKQWGNFSDGLTHAVARVSRSIHCVPSSRDEHGNTDFAALWRLRRHVGL
jgi:Homeodomain-like domain